MTGISKKVFGLSTCFEFARDIGGDRGIGILEMLASENVPRYHSGTKTCKLVSLIIWKETR